MYRHRQVGRMGFYQTHIHSIPPAECEPSWCSTKGLLRTTDRTVVFRGIDSAILSCQRVPLQKPIAESLPMRNRRGVMPACT